MSKKSDVAKVVEEVIKHLPTRHNQKKHGKSAEPQVGMVYRTKETDKEKSDLVGIDFAFLGSRGEGKNLQYKVLFLDTYDVDNFNVSDLKMDLESYRGPSASEKKKIDDALKFIKLDKHLPGKHDQKTHAGSNVGKGNPVSQVGEFKATEVAFEEPPRSAKSWLRDSKSTMRAEMTDAAEDYGKDSEDFKSIKESLNKEGIFFKKMADAGISHLGYYPHNDGRDWFASRDNGETYFKAAEYIQSPETGLQVFNEFKF